MGLGVVGPPNGPRLNVRFKPAASISATPVTPDFCTRTGAEAGADIGKGKSITAERSRHTAPTLLQSDDTPRPRQATYWVGTTSLCGCFYCNSALVNGRLQIVGCHVALREFAARLIAPQFASERWLLSILEVRGVPGVLCPFIKHRLAWSYLVLIKFHGQATLVLAAI
jgi:hypothetical protein